MTTSLPFWKQPVPFAVKIEIVWKYLSGSFESIKEIALTVAASYFVCLHTIRCYKMKGLEGLFEQDVGRKQWSYSLEFLSFIVKRSTLQ